MEKKYDYRTAITTDIIEYIAEDFEPEALTAIDLLDEWSDYTRDLEHRLWITDSVTGNCSGSYWFSAWKAEEAICHNLDIYERCLSEWGGEPTFDAETIDVVIRCFLLGECLGAVVEAITSHLEYAAAVVEESNSLIMTHILTSAIETAENIA